MPGRSNREQEILDDAMKLDNPSRGPDASEVS